jgi:hypothetical protein
VRRILSGILITAIISLCASAALAQDSKKPTGIWQSTNHQVILIVGDYGSCTFGFTDIRTYVEGDCDYNVAGKVGKLHILNMKNFANENLYYEITMLSRTKMVLRDKQGPFTLRRTGDVTPSNIRELHLDN